MKKLIVLIAALATTLAATTSAEARDRGYGRHHHGYRHSSHSPRYCAPRPICRPTYSYYAPRYCAPRPVCPPRVSYYGYGRPSVHLSFGFGGRPGYRW